MSLHPCNKTGQGMAVAKAQREVVKSGFIEIPVPRKTHVQSYQLIDKWGGRQT